MRYLRLLLIFLLFWACEPKMEDPYQTFLIPEGTHDNGWIMQSLQSKTIKFSVIFDQSAIYQTASESNQGDINKLVGFSDCNSFHHENSARFGWRWIDETLEIHAYAYVDGERSTKYIGSVELEKSSTYRLSISDDFYTFFLEGHDPVRIERSAPCQRGLYYMLFPYFGGDEKAPHDILIKIHFQY